MIRLYLILLTSALCPPAQAAVGWGDVPVWDDGLAEVAIYNATRSAYGKTRSYETILITVKEDLNADTYTKADFPYEGKRLLPVLKLNIVSEVVTENYPYRYLTSVFVDRSDVLRLHKLTTASQEWCGNTFKMVQTWGGPPKILYHSYWEDQSDGSYLLDTSENRLLEDQLPVSLRSLPFKAGYRRDIRLVRSLISNRAPVPQVIEAVMEVQKLESLTVAAGNYRAWPVRITGEGVSLTLWFQSEPPNILLKSESDNGRSLKLQQTERRKYW